MKDKLNNLRIYFIEELKNCKNIESLKAIEDKLI
jgi:hypothetical protein